MRLIGYLIGSLMLAISGGGIVEPQRCVVEVSYAYYDVTGSTLEQVQASIRQLGPVDEGGKRRYARTDWKVEWSWEKNDSGIIQPGTVKVLCKAVITLPRLTPSSTLPPDQEQRWAAYEQLLAHHEMNHVRHVQALAPKISSRIEERQERSGKVSAKTAQRIAKAVLQEIRELDRFYDRHTRHGASEGI